MNNSPIILIIDDEKAILQTLQEALLDEGFRVRTLNDGACVLNVIGELIPDMILLDIFMPNCNGIELLSKIKREYPQQKVIIISGFGNIPLAVDAVKNGALDFIEKPLNLDDILSKLSILKSDFAPSEKDASQNSNLDYINYGIIGESALFIELMTQVNNIKNLKYPLLIYGQHGTGKTLISKFIHSTSSFKDLPFTQIHCSDNTALDFSKLEGIIFLRNIESLNHNNQQLLLNFLGSSNYAEKNICGKIRIIASLCNPLWNDIKEQKWNSRLFHKLNVTPIEIPSLSKRRYDIPLLIDHLVKIFNQKFQKNISISNLGLRYLRNKDWPENVAELEKFIANIVLTSKQTTTQISIEEIQHLVPEKDIEFVEEQTFLTFDSLDQATKAFQKNYISHVIKKSHFDLIQASDKLKLGVEELKHKLKELGLDKTISESP